MATRTIKNEYNFIKGYFTESSPLNFPSNACLDINNFDIFRTGLIGRRQGLDAENGFSLRPAVKFTEDIIRNEAICADVWTSVAGDGNLNFVVVQIDTILYFHDLSASGAISGNFKTFTVDLNTFKSPTATDAGRYPISAASGNGYLFIASPSLEPFYITYNKTADTIATTVIVRQIRDYMGVEDGLKVDENPTTLSPEHHYNLFNQGWTDTQINAYFSKYNNYPSNAQIWWEAKDSNGNFDVNLMAQIQFGTTHAPRGHFIVDPFNIDRSTASGIGGLPIVKIDTRPSAITFFNDRLFLAINAQVLYSQVFTTDVTNAGKFLPLADSASEIDSILVATDGGYINITDAGQMTALLQTETSVIVGATNGIWAITGWSGQGFQADAYRVMLVADVAITNPNNICKVEDSLVCISDGGIYLLMTSDRGNINITNITLPTIQTFFLNLSKQTRSQSNLIYDNAAKRLYMLYNPNADDSVANTSIYTNALILDMTLYALNEGKGGFYKYAIATLPSFTNFISDAVLLKFGVLNDLELNVVIDDDEVLIDADQVIIVDQVSTPTEAQLTFLLITGTEADGYNYTFGQFSNVEFVDWGFVNDAGISFDSYLITAPAMLEDITRIKGVPYIWMAFERTEQSFIDDGEGQVKFDFPSSALLRAQWDWTTTATAGRWSNPQQVYRLKNIYWGAIGDIFDYSYSVVETKTSLSGHGKALSLRLSSEPNKNCRVLGWSLEYSVVMIP